MLQNVYSTTEIDTKETNLKNVLTALINTEASTARANETTLTTNLTNHINDTVIHTTQTEKDKWNVKLKASDLTASWRHCTEDQAMYEYISHTELKVTFLKEENYKVNYLDELTSSNS